jgi:hypothetical protein
MHVCILSLFDLLKHMVHNNEGKFYRVGFFFFFENFEGSTGFLGRFFYIIIKLRWYQKAIIMHGKVRKYACFQYLMDFYDYPPWSFCFNKHSRRLSLFPIFRCSKEPAELLRISMRFTFKGVL